MALTLTLALAHTTPAAPAAAPSFTIENDEFVRDGKVAHLRAGCVHYSRVPAEYWEDRLLRLKAMGLNAIQTYVPWNWHEPVRGEFNWEGDRDLGQFLATAQKVGLLVVLRAGPYMCGEWCAHSVSRSSCSRSGGGAKMHAAGAGSSAACRPGSSPTDRSRSAPTPSPTSATSTATGRRSCCRCSRSTSTPRAATSSWCPPPPLLSSPPAHPFASLQVQCENEYGSYGDVSKHPTDKQYMLHLISTAREVLGEDVILFTTDGGDEGFMTRGSINGSMVYTVGDGCGSPQTCVDAQKAFNPPGKSPFMCSECYTGWLTHWGEAGANTSSSAPHVDSILGKFGGSVSLYMGHGGTNWGFWSGANGGGGTSFQPHITSYDYDSPVSEAGEHGYNNGLDKYAAMQTVLKKYASKDEVVPPEPPLLPRTAYGQMAMTQRAGLLANLAVLSPEAAATNTDATPFAESLGPACHYGFMVYSTKLSAPEAAPGSQLTITAGGLRDRAQVGAATAGLDP